MTMKNKISEIIISAVNKGNGKVKLIRHIKPIMRIQPKPLFPTVA